MIFFSENDIKNIGQLVGSETFRVAAFPSNVDYSFKARQDTELRIFSTVDMGEDFIKELTLIETRKVPKGTSVEIELLPLCMREEVDFLIFVQIPLAEDPERVFNPKEFDMVKQYFARNVARTILKIPAGSFDLSFKHMFGIEALFDKYGALMMDSSEKLIAAGCNKNPSYVAALRYKARNKFGQADGDIFTDLVYEEMVSVLESIGFHAMMDKIKQLTNGTYDISAMPVKK